MPPPTIAPPSQAAPRTVGANATAKPTPVRTMAATSDKKVSAMLYPVGIPGENASMAMKCVAQIPKPLAVAETREPNAAHLAGRLADVVEQADGRK